MPWVDHVWGYMRYPRHALPLLENLGMVRRLRREKFDVLHQFKTVQTAPVG